MPGRALPVAAVIAFGLSLCFAPIPAAHGLVKDTDKLRHIDAGDCRTPGHCVGLGAGDGGVAVMSITKGKLGRPHYVKSANLQAGQHLVACPNRTTCFAAAGGFSASAGQYVELIKWHSGNVSVIKLHRLAVPQSIGCLSSTTCIVSGTSSHYANKAVVLAHGTVQAVHGTPIRASLTCGGARGCVGYDEADLVVFAADGTPGPKIPLAQTGLRITSLSCPGKHRCWALSERPDASFVVVAVHFDGSEGTPRKLPKVREGGAIACWTGRSCYVAGSVDVRGAAVNRQALIPIHGGVPGQPLKLTRGDAYATGGTLYDISCGTTRRTCTTVGWEYDGGHGKGLAAWTGS